MQIAILSDTHDNIWKLDALNPHLRHADVILHCGDLCSPFVVVRLAQGAAGKPVHVVWGNNDGDQRLLTLKALEAGNVHIHGQFAALELDGLSVAINHYPEIARPVAMSGQYDLVCYGHDHTAHKEMIGDTLLLNPGDVMGLHGRSTFAWFDTRTRQARWVELT